MLTKLKNGNIWKRIFIERLTEPLHLNAMSLLVAAFGSYRQKVNFDLVVRNQHAYGILCAADSAKELGIDEVSIIEFGVASGAGLMNICRLAQRTTEQTGVKFHVTGFDTGRGMPQAQSFRDHPELYQAGDFPMEVDKLKNSLPGNATLVLGPLEETVPRFLATLNPSSPVGFVSLDVDYYSSSRTALTVFDGPAENYLPVVSIYLDDVNSKYHNTWCGERLAVKEFTDSREMRKIEHHVFLRNSRIMKNATWIDHMVSLHVLDHPKRTNLGQTRGVIELNNPYF